MAGERYWGERERKKVVERLGLSSSVGRVSRRFAAGVGSVVVRLGRKFEVLIALVTSCYSSVDSCMQWLQAG